VTASLQLQHEGWHADLRPDIGGAIARLDWSGAPLLHPAPPGASGPISMACFPLLPYANRIANGRFGFAGTAHHLPANFGDHPHSLHGVGWQSAWQVETRTTDSATLSHVHPAGPAWPWPYRATQTIRLAAGLVAISLRLTNSGQSPMPAGLGLHPCFPLHRETRLTATAAGVVLTDETALPTGALAAADHFGDWARGACVADAGFVDHALSGWSGTARIDQPDHRIRLSSTGARAFHLFTPTGEARFCFEPVSHLPDALNRPAFEIDILQPGQTATLSMTLAVSRD
jgi:aldose 1-epimerase